MGVYGCRGRCPGSREGSERRRFGRAAVRLTAPLHTHMLYSTLQSCAFAAKNSWMHTEHPEPPIHLWKIPDSWGFGLVTSSHTPPSFPSLAFAPLHRFCKLRAQSVAEACQLRGQLRGHPAGLQPLVLLGGQRSPQIRCRNDGWARDPVKGAERSTVARPRIRWAIQDQNWMVDCD